MLRGNSNSSLSPWRMKYDGNNKAKWNKLVSQNTEELLRKNIGYILNPAALAARVAEIEAPNILPIPNQETAAQANIRIAAQNRVEKIWLSRMAKRDTDIRKVDDDFGIAIVVLKDQVSDIIRDDLNALLNRADNILLDNRAKYALIFNRLETQWGPHNQGDVDK
mmetsp:Transcript_5125/g.7160  ORF Transcript_5125/g.7160 Transcript_5125/m.7160 type:complete len:165 (-) Transcript_5125:1881-2375(-)